MSLMTEQPPPSPSAEERPQTLIARWRQALTLAADFPRPESVGYPKAGRWVLLGLASSLALLSLVGVWSLPTWWAAVTPYSPVRQWTRAFVVVAWCWYGLYAAVGAWCLRKYPLEWVRRAWLPVFVGCMAISLIVLGLFAIRPGLT